MSDEASSSTDDRSDGGEVVYQVRPVRDRPQVDAARWAAEVAGRITALIVDGRLPMALRAEADGAGRVLLVVDVAVAVVFAEMFAQEPGAVLGG